MTIVRHELPDHVLLHDGELDDDLLRQRAAAGLDRWDEIWNGVLHLVPSPSLPHQEIVLQLGFALFERVRQRGLRLTHEINLLDRELQLRDYRIPDLVVFRSEDAEHLGVTGAEVAVEVRSPRDETYLKFPFYASHGVGELVVIYPDSRDVELYRLDGDEYVLADESPEGAVTIRALDVDLSTVETDDGPRLRVVVGAVTSDV